jgi:hypothetical protein
VLYTQLLDPELSRTEHDRDVAEEIVKLNVFAGQKPKITTSFAIDSALILGRWSHDPAFRALIKVGDIVVPRWPKGDGPSDALATVLADDNYVFTDWPSHLNGSSTLRREAIAYLGKGPKTGDAQVNEMIETAREFFVVIEHSPSMGVDREKNRKPIFKAGMLAIRKACERRHAAGSEGLSAQLFSAIRAVSQYMPECERRSDLYQWNYTNHPELQPIIKGWIDTLYNECFPAAFGGSVRFHAAMAGAQQWMPVSGLPAPVKRVDGFRPTDFSKIDWRDLWEIRDSKDKRQEVASRYAQRCMGQSKLFVVVGGATLSLLAGALAQWAIAAAGAGGMSAGLKGLEVVEESIKKEAATRLDGYLKAIG